MLLLLSLSISGGSAVHSTALFSVSGVLILALLFACRDLHAQLKASLGNIEARQCGASLQVVDVIVVLVVVVVVSWWYILLVRVEVDDLLGLLPHNFIRRSLDGLNSATAQMAPVQGDVGQERYCSNSATKPRAIQRVGHLTGTLKNVVVSYYLSVSIKLFPNSYFPAMQSQSASKFNWVLF